MQGAKPWQIAVIVVGLLGAIVVAFMSTLGSEEPQFADSMTVADVQTGEIFTVEFGKKAIVLPMTRKGNSVATLYPVYQKEGTWVVEERYREVNAAAFKDSKVYNPSSGAIAATGDPKDLDE
jgi:hypothetical protein